jgi:aminobenzoyl-glutamate utilization protein B
MDADDVEIALKKPLHADIYPFDPKETGYSSGSTDVGDVGYATPTLMFNVATACMGNVGHSWQNTAFSGSDIGMKGMLRAAKVMALGTYKLMKDPSRIEAAKEEFRTSLNGETYVCPIDDSIPWPYK